MIIDISGYFCGLIPNIFSRNIKKTIKLPLHVQTSEQPKRLEFATKQFIPIKIKMVSVRSVTPSIIHTLLTLIWHAQYDAGNVYTQPSKIQDTFIFLFAY